jgi:Flp pilus assembly protein TadG
MQNRPTEHTMSTMQQSLRRFFGGTEPGIGGVAAIEFAIFAPVLIFMMLCVVDLGMGIYRKMQVQNAAQAGAQYAMVHGFNAGLVSTAVQSATSFSGISASPPPTQFCGCTSSTGVTSISCNSTCSGGSTPGTFVTVSTQGTYNTLYSYPSIANTYNFTAQSTVRIQ